jgi:hypothetical protein
MNGLKLINACEAYIHPFKNLKMKIHNCNANIYSVNSVFGTSWFQIMPKLKLNASPASKYTQ